MEPVVELIKDKKKSEKKVKSEKQEKWRTDKSEKKEKSRTDKKSEKKVDKEKKDKKKEEVIEWAPSLSDRMGTIAPLLMATGGAIAYTRFPVVQSFVNSAVAQLMESLVSPESAGKSSAPRGCASVLLPPAS